MIVAAVVVAEFGLAPGAGRAIRELALALEVVLAEEVVVAERGFVIEPVAVQEVVLAAVLVVAVQVFVLEVALVELEVVLVVEGSLGVNLRLAGSGEIVGAVQRFRAFEAQALVHNHHLWRHHLVQDCRIALLYGQ